MKDIREVIADLDPVLRGRGYDFRSGNASKKFAGADSDVWQRSTRLLATVRGREGVPLAGRTRAMLRDRPRAAFEALGLHRSVGTNRFPGSPHAA